ncbi:hypothetical protein WN944_004267 [Citrus x changshan-huyou]|uniref:Uncharacterized protein n=1 Tax=Citrus x changshan-huyou TaxID=2935761 RepID=A0AAP0M033_9ROSI
MARGAGFSGVNPPTLNYWSAVVTHDYALNTSGHYKPIPERNSLSSPVKVTLPDLGFKSGPATRILEIRETDRQIDNHQFALSGPFESDSTPSTPALGRRDDDSHWLCSYVVSFSRCSFKYQTHRFNFTGILMERYLRRRIKQLYPPVLCFHEISSSIIYDVQQSMIVCVVSGCGLGGSTTKAAPQTAAASSKQMMKSSRVGNWNFQCRFRKSSKRKAGGAITIGLVGQWI